VYPSVTKSRSSIFRASAFGTISVLESFLVDYAILLRDVHMKLGKLVTSLVTNLSIFSRVDIYHNVVFCVPHPVYGCDCTNLLKPIATFTMDLLVDLEHYELSMDCEVSGVR
jgi:hypothetical protein